MPVPTPLNTETFPAAPGDKDFQLSAPVAVAVDADSSVLVLEGGLSFSEGGVTVRPAVFRYALDLKQPGGTVRTRVARLVKSVKEKSSPVDMVMDRIDKTAPWSFSMPGLPDCGSYLWASTIPRSSTSRSIRRA